MRTGRPIALLTAAGFLLLSAATGAGAATTEIDLGGAPLPAGSPTDQGAPVVLGAGVWSDRLGGADSNQDQHFFRYERRIADSTVHVGVIGAPLAGAAGADGLGVAVSTGDTACGEATDSASSYTPQAVLGASVAVGADAPDERDNECLSAASLDIAVDRGYGSSPDELPIALKIVEEAPVASTTDLPVAVEDDTFRPVQGAGAGEELPGATSFADAPALDASPDGVTITTTLVEGETALWRVPVGWGERVSATVDLEPHDDGDEDVTFYGPDVDLRLISPMRAVTTLTTEDGVSVDTYAEEEPVRLVVGTVETRYLNRYGSVPSPTVPGDHWIEVAVEPQDETEDADGEPIAPVEVPVTLTVAVVGGDGAGAAGGVPTHATTVSAPGSGAGPAGYAPETPFLVGQQDGEPVFSAVADDEQVLPASLEDDGWWGTRRYAGLGLAVLSVACCGAGLWRLRRR